MFKRVRKALGRLKLGEVYGFVLALELGGRARVETTRRLHALEHLSILAQLGPVSVHYYTDGRQTFVREMGAGRMTVAGF